MLGVLEEERWKGQPVLGFTALSLNASQCPVQIPLVSWESSPCVLWLPGRRDQHFPVHVPSSGSCREFWTPLILLFSSPGVLSCSSLDVHSSLCHLLSWPRLGMFKDLNVLKLCVPALHTELHVGLHQPWAQQEIPSLASSYPEA